MQRTIIALSVLAAVLLVGFYALNGYIYKAKQADLSAYSAGTYSYQCADGMEFALSLPEDMSTILIVPAPEGARIPTTILTKVPETNARYEGDGIVFAGNGETVILSTAEFQTSCSPILNPGEAPFNFGDPEPSYEPYRATLEGEYLCLPHVDTDGPQTMECAFGIKTDAGDYFAVDFSLMSQIPPALETGDRFSASGLVTPIERLSTDHWRQYPVKGIFSVTDSVEKI